MIKLFINNIEYSDFIIDTPILSAEFEDGKLIGNAPSVCFNVTLDNSYKTFDSLLDEEFVIKDYKTNNQIGVFKVVEKPERITNELVLSLYDNMIETNIAYDTDTTLYPTTIAKQIQEMEVMLSRTIDTSELGVNVINYPAEWYDNTISIRDFLCFIGELGACNLFCTPEGNFKFIRIKKESVHQIPLSDVETVDVIEDFKCSRIVFDNGAVVPIEFGDTTGNTIYISKDNPYLETQKQIDYIYSIIGGIEFKTIENFVCIEMENLILGDIFTFNNTNFIVLKYRHELLSGEFGIQTIDGNLVIKNAELVTQHIDNTVKIHRLKTEFDQEKLKWSVTAQEVEGNTQKIGSLELSNEEINQSIIKIEETVKNIDITYYHAEVTCSGTSITRDNSSITMSVQVLNKSEEVATSESAFNWKRVSSNTESDVTWNNAHKGRKSIVITSSDLEASANFYCEIKATEWQGSTSAITVVDEVKSQIPIGSITANQPNTQTLDEEGNVTPKWGLTLTPSMQFGVYSPDLSEITTAWKRRINDEPLSDLTSKEVVKDNVLTVTGDILSESVRSVTYYCYMQYEYSTCMAEKTFTLVKDGGNGNDGVSIVSTATMYAVSTSEAEVPTSGWITSRPNRPVGSFLWMKMRITYSDSTQTETEAVVISGDKGDKGEDGKGIASYAITYQASTSGTTTPTGTWTSSIPSVQQGQYLWSRTITTYTDKTTSTVYSVSYIPVNGSTGATGTSIVSTVQQYFLSTSKVNPTGGSWTTTPPTWSSGKYLWTRFVITYKNPTSTDYTIPVCDSSWEAVNEIEVGGRNLLLKSGDSITSDSYIINSYYIGNEAPKEDDEVTITVKATLGAGKRYFGIFNSGGKVALVTIYPTDFTNGIAQKTFKWKVTSGSTTADNTYINVYHMPSATTVESTINWIRLDFGNKAPLIWTPAPEDVKQEISDTEVRITESYNSAIQTTVENIKAFVEESVESVGDWQSALSTLKNEVVLTKDATEFLKSSSQIITDLQNGKVDINEIKEWARFNGATLELGASNSVYKVKLTTTELGFYQGSTKVAWISNNELHVTDIVAEHSVTIGTRGWIDEGSYGFTLKRVGD